MGQAEGKPRTGFDLGARRGWGSEIETSKKGGFIIVLIVVDDEGVSKHPWSNTRPAAGRGLLRVTVMLL